MSCVESGVFKGLVSVAATIPFYAVEGCDKAAPLSALLIHGMQDTVMPQESSTYRQYKVFLSFEESVDWWMARNGCHNTSIEQHDFRLSIGKVDVLSSKGCRSLTQVIAYRVNDGGHAWPGRDHPQNRTRGHVNRDIDASRIVSDWIMRLQDS